MGKKVHFMGIAGSGLAPIAIIANYMGYEVTGCDIADDTYYSEELKKNGISIQLGHDETHVHDADILAVTPAVFDYNPNHPELLAGKEKGILMTWQQFSGEYLQKDKKVIAICGTHGKSSTTSMIGLMLERAGLDPLVEAGTIIKEWGSGYRLSSSDYFVCEADEFNNNFLFYHPSYLIINNIEMDHPEFFHDEMEMKNSYVKFIQNLVGEKQLIANFDDEGVLSVLEMAKSWILEHEVKISGYATNLRNVPSWIDGEIFEYKINHSTPEGTFYEINHELICQVGILGKGNVSNAMSAYCLSQVLSISFQDYQESMKNFHGIGRRLEKKYDQNDITIYDDYAHHPTEIKNVLSSLKSVYPNRTLVGIVEPHQISRLKLFFEEFCDAFSIADQMIVTKTFVGREVHKNLEPVDMKRLEEKLENLKYIEDFSDVVNYVAQKFSKNVVIVVMGAGYSYQLTNNLVKVFQNL